MMEREPTSQVNHGHRGRPATRPRRADPADAVKGVALRVSVGGLGDTFDLCRLLHEALAARRRRVFAKAGLARPTGTNRTAVALRRRLQDARLLRDVRHAGPVDTLVLENREGGLPGLAFNTEVCQAQVVLLTSVARDPEDGSLRPSAERAAEFAQSVPPFATLVSGEADPVAREALQRGCREGEAFFVDGAPRGPTMPGLESITVLDRFLRLRLGAGLTTAERVRLLARLERRLQWSPSALPDVRWHDGGRMDAGRLRPVLEHLLHRWPARAHLVLHFDAPQADEARRFAPVLRQAVEDGLASHVHVAGAGSSPIVRGLGNSLPLTVYGRSPSSVPGLLRILRREGRGGAVITVGDAGAPWMRSLLGQVRRPGLPRGAWAPYEAEGSDLPAPILPARPAAVAPRFGQRSRAHVLGDPDPDLVVRRPSAVAPVPLGLRPRSRPA